MAVILRSLFTLTLVDIYKVVRRNVREEREGVEAIKVS